MRSPMLDISKILERLDKVRKSGKHYMACCPVHQDNSPSMSITEKDDVILIHCHACGANGVDVVSALGLNSDVLFDKPFERDSDKNWLLNKKSDWDETVIVVSYETLRRGEALSYNDYKALKQSLARREERRKRGLKIINNMEINL